MAERKSESMDRCDRQRAALYTCPNGRFWLRAVENRVHLGVTGVVTDAVEPLASRDSRIHNLTRYGLWIVLGSTVV